MSVPRAVLDTNIIVAALLGKSAPAQLYDAFKADAFQCVLSRELMAELADVLLRPSLSIPPRDVKTVFQLLRNHAFIMRHTPPIMACRDPKDNIVLECALAGGAHWIVTGDHDLLVLHPFRGIQIVSPGIFLKHLSLSSR